MSGTLQRVPGADVDGAWVDRVEALVRRWLATEVFDAMGEPGEDERWEIFYEFHEYLQKEYPLV